MKEVVAGTVRSSVGVGYIYIYGVCQMKQFDVDYKISGVVSPTRKLNFQFGSKQLEDTYSGFV